MPDLEQGDLWLVRRPDDWIVVPTNPGWKRNGDAVMGRGVALQASARYPDLASWYGYQCRVMRGDPGVVRFTEGKLFLLPTKPFLATAPNRSWAQPADLDLITRGLVQLRALCQDLEPGVQVLTPLLGCGEGGLEPEIVRETLRALAVDRLRIVDTHVNSV